jgi:hypothetical protein
VAEEAAEEAVETGGEAALRPPAGVRGPAAARVPPAVSAAERVTAAAPRATEEAGEAIIEKSRKDLMREIVGNVPGAQAANPSVARRMGKVANLADEMVPDDAELMASLSNPRRAMGVAQQRLDAAAENLRPANKLLDDAAGRPTAPADLFAPVDEEIRKMMGRLGDSTEKKAVRTFRANLVEELADMRKVGKFGITTQDLRDLTTKTLKHENEAMGSLAETTKFKIQEQLHDMMQGIYNRRLDKVAKVMGDPGKRLVADIRAANRKVRLYAQIRDTMKNRLDLEQAGRRGLIETLQQGGITGLGTRLGLRVGGAVERRATRALARLIKARRGREPIPESAVREAIKEGVPEKTVHAVMSGTESLAEVAEQAGAVQ